MRRTHVSLSASLILLVAATLFLVFGRKEGILARTGDSYTIPFGGTRYRVQNGQRVDRFTRTPPPACYDDPDDVPETGDDIADRYHRAMAWIYYYRGLQKTGIWGPTLAQHYRTQYNICRELRRTHPEYTHKFDMIAETYRHHKPCIALPQESV